MARRAGLSRDSVIDAAAAIADERGFDDLSIAGLAEALGVRPPSLYHHVGGLDDIRRSLTARAHQVLRDISQAARKDRRGRDAFVAQCHAYRQFSKDHPGLYAALNAGLSTPSDTELWDSMLLAIEPVMDTMADLDLEGEAMFEALRLFRASIHGFLSLEMASGYGFDLDVDRSFERLVEVLVTGLQVELT